MPSSTQIAALTAGAFALGMVAVTSGTIYAFRVHIESEWTGDATESCDIGVQYHLDIRTGTGDGLVPNLGQRDRLLLPAVRS